MRALLTATISIISLCSIAAVATAQEDGSSGADERPLAASLDGATGVARVDSARTGMPGYWEIGGHGLWFQQRGFGYAGGVKDYDEFSAGVGSLSWTVSPALELFVSSQVRENYNSTSAPHLSTADGSLRAGAKLSTALGGDDPMLWLAAEGGTSSPPAVEQVQFRPDTWGAWGMGLATVDLSGRGTPFRLHANLGAELDQSSRLYVPGQNAARTFALGLYSKQHATRIDWGLAAEAPTSYVTPFLEISGAKPNGVSFTDAPGYLTAGIRVTAVKNLSLDLAGDIGLTRSVIAGVPATPEHELLFGASYSFASAKVHRREFERENVVPPEMQAQLEDEKQRADDLENKLEAALLAEQVAEEAQKKARAQAALTSPDAKSAWEIAREEATKADELRRRLESDRSLGDTTAAQPVAARTASAASAVMGAAGAGERGDLATAERAVSAAEKSAADAQQAAADVKAGPDGDRLARPAEITSGQAQKAAAAARAALDNARKLAASGATGGAGATVATASFRGLVLDATTFAPLPNAVISFPDADVSRLLTDPQSGLFRSVPFAPGTVSVSIEAPGYQPLLQPVSLHTGSDEVVRFLMQKSGAAAGRFAAGTPGFFQGRILDEKGNPVANAKLAFPDAPGVRAADVSMNDGAFRVQLPPGLYQVDVQAPGYLLQGRRVSVGPGENVRYDYVLRPVPTERLAEATGSNIMLKDVIRFAFDSDVIDKSSYPILDEVADILLWHPEYHTIRIEGHTDDVGGESYNLTLSDRRAQSVVSYLRGKGVPAERMIAVGWGKAKPIADGTDDVARALNRRVEFKVSQE